MNPQTFFEHFERLADAPNAVPRLRGLILQLAVQGKLVEQDERDEPATRLLERISAERKRLVKEKKIKEAKPLPPVSDDEKPFILRNGWTWARLGNASLIIQIGPFGSQLHKSDYVQNGTPLVNPSHIKGERIVASNKLTIDEKTKQRLSNYIMKSGDIVMGRRGEMGKCALVTEKEDGWLCGTGSLFIRFTEHLFQPYLLKVLVSDYTKIYLLSNSVGSTMNNLNQKILDNLLVALPPLEEQKRIVAKVDELMRLCDELERKQTERNAACLDLNRVMLDRLLAAHDATEFQASWQAVCDYFATITATPDLLSKLRQTVLQLAVQGKLTHQDPQDEPATSLLRRIRAERERLVKEKLLKRADSLPTINLDKMPFALPNGWTWARIGDLARASEYGTSQKASDIKDDVPVLRMNNINAGKVIYENLKYLPASIDDLPRLYLQHNDLLFNRTNSYELVGKTAIYKGENNKMTFASYLIRLSLFSDLLDVDFVNLVMNSAYFRKHQIEPNITQQNGQANFNGTKLSLTFIPFPPLKEQKNIVAAVNRLMALCDELEAGLSRAEEDGEQLLRAAVHSLLTSTTEDSAVESAALVVQ
ncbi:MAG: restriction endonuclease subunit S [Acidobacteria bacterium]|nr:restriction endonuclease subunit S [Acidobacteriota bacterium]